MTREGFGYQPALDGLRAALGARGAAVPRGGRRVRRRLPRRLGVLHLVRVPDHEPDARRAGAHRPGGHRRVLRPPCEAAAARRASRASPPSSCSPPPPTGSTASSRCAATSSGAVLQVANWVSLAGGGSYQDLFAQAAGAGVAGRALLVARDRGAVLLAVPARVRRPVADRRIAPRAAVLVVLATTVVAAAIAPLVVAAVGRRCRVLGDACSGGRDPHRSARRVPGARARRPAGVAFGPRPRRCWRSPSRSSCSPATTDPRTAARCPLVGAVSAC